MLGHHSSLKTLLLIHQPKKRAKLWTKTIANTSSDPMFSRTSPNCYSVSLFFSHSSWLSLLLSHTLDKNCIFLLFNGLVVFLAKTSGRITSSSKHKAVDHHYHGEYSKPESMFLEIEVSLVEKEVSHHDDETNTGPNHEHGVAHETTKSSDDESIIVEEEIQKLMEVATESELWTEEVEEEDGTLSTEELNKKFDEFIRKMEELRIEAQQQQLIMV